MKRRLLAVSVGLLLVATFMGWPDPVDPVAFEPPLPAVSGPEDHRLQRLERISLDGWTGPEDVVVGPDDTVYVAVEQGAVLRRTPGDEGWTPFVKTEGRPLGLVLDREDRLVIADPYRGLLRVERDGTLSVLVPARHEAAPGEPSLCYANNVDVASDGTLYVSDSTQRFCPPDHGGTFEASLLDIIEHRRTGRLIAVRPDGEVDVVMRDLQFANGVAWSEASGTLLVAETGDCRIWRYDPVSGERELLLEGLPGYPDNLTRGRDGRFWLGFTKPRSIFMDRYAAAPELRKLIARLPRALYPVPPPFSHVVAIDEHGRVLERHQDPAGGYPEATGATETSTGLYVHSLTAPALGVLSNAQRQGPADEAAL